MFDDLDQKLLQCYQRDFPLTARPYLEIGSLLGVEEDEIMERFRRLQDRGFISRIGPLLNHKKIGASTLAAIAVPDEAIETCAGIINEYKEVNHNYLREHRYNLWFVVTARDEGRLKDVIAEIECRTGCVVLELPMVKSFYIDLGFELW